jgi:hypothetical protein
MGPARRYGALEIGAPTGDLVRFIFSRGGGGYTHPHLTTTPGKEDTRGLEHERVDWALGRHVFDFITLCVQ